MKELNNPKLSFSGTSIAKNTIYNLLGYGIPILFALVLIPPLITGLGKERFGILNLIWIVIGYFSFLDFGIGRSLTKVISEKIGQNKIDQIPIIFWTALILMFSVSLIVAIISIIFIPTLLNQFLNISQGLKSETFKTFFALSLSIPLIATTAGLRGVLEAYQKFYSVNILRIVLGIFTFLGPLLVLAFTNSLFWIVIFLIFIRFIIWVSYLFLCFKFNNEILKGFGFSLKAVKPALKFSVWISISNIIGPIILYSDRFLIGSLVSAVAITYYATPYEMVTKLLLIPGALVGVLFPIFSASFEINPEISKKFLMRGIKFAFLIIYPTVLLISTFSYEAIQVWLGKEFAENSARILQFLSIGILMNSISMIPNIFFQGTGKPKIPTLINLTELPFYLFAMWFTINKWNIMGAAITYMVMATIDAAIMILVAKKIFSIKIYSRNKLLFVIVMIFVLSIPFVLNTFIYKLLFVVITASIFILIGVKYFLSFEEKKFFLNKLQNVYKSKSILPQTNQE